MKRFLSCLSLLALPLALSAQTVLPPWFVFPDPPEDVGPCSISSLEIEADVIGPYALVSETFHVQNPNARPLEAALSLPLPAGATLSGFALDVAGELREGVLVGKEKARIAFEDEVRRGVDPGLAEHVAGNLFRTRVYPVPAEGGRVVRVSFLAPLVFSPAGDAALSLPQPREPLARRSVRISCAVPGAEPPSVGGLGDAAFAQAEARWVLEKTETDVSPADDILLALPALPAVWTACEKAEDGSQWAAVSAALPAPAAKKGKKAGTPERIDVFYDASLSRAAADRKKETAFLRALPAARFRLFVLRDAVAPAVEFGDADSLAAAVEALPFEGGTDFAALGKAFVSTVPPDADPRAALLFTDGLDTLSGVPLPAVRATAVVATGVSDFPALEAACEGGVIDLSLATAKEAAALWKNPPVRAVRVEGADPEDVQLVNRPGWTTALVRREKGGRAKLALVLNTGETIDAGEPEDAGKGETLRKAWGQRAIAVLGASGGGENEEDLLALSRRYGLAGPAASFLVLESADQWIRHGIEPPQSLPKEREAFRKAKKREESGKKDAGEAHMEAVRKAWKERCKWYDDPIPPREPKGTRGGFLANALARGGAARDAAPADGMVAEEMAMYDMAAEAPGGFVSMGCRSIVNAAEEAGGAPEEESESAAARGARIQVAAWSADSPYVKEILSKRKTATRLEAYLAAQAENAATPAFYLEAGDALCRAGETALGRRALSNLAELSLGEPALLRVFAWRMEQAGDLDCAVHVLRRVARLRPDEGHSFRDLALALAKRGKKEMRAEDVSEALELFLKVVVTPWHRHDDILPVFALEEFHSLAAWTTRQEWEEGKAPVVPALPKGLERALDYDIRIALSWDADNTDVDLHVVEPSGEEAYFGHQRTRAGGLVTRDVVDGYGPEAYFLKDAAKGTYEVFAHYYASHQQTLLGPATVIATVFTDFGRAEETSETMTLRLDRGGATQSIGKISFAKKKPAKKEGKKDGEAEK